MRTIVFIFLLCLQTVFSQNKVSSGRIVYGVTFLEEQSISKSKMTHLYETSKEIGKTLEFNLDFNEHQALFYSKSGNGIEERKVAIAYAFAGYTVPLYVDLKADMVFWNNKESLLFKVNEFKVFKTFSKKWKLESETKIIDGYTCFKATSELEVNNAKGRFVHPVTAWYCPSIPIQFGPKGYGSLPGLILELQERNVVYGLKSINFSFPIDALSIQEPVHGKLISEEEYHKTIEERATQVKDFVKQ